MITDIEVDGFRSLVKFKLRLTPGLNLLVGPNGSGKTNIISFLGFLSEITRANLSLAVSNLGGSGAVFRKHGEKRYHSQIRAIVRGKAPADPEYGPRDDEGKPIASSKQFAYFEYAFTVQLSEDRESVYFAKQALRLHVSQDSTLPLEDITDWHADIEINGRPDGTVSCTRANLSPFVLEEFRPSRRPDDYSPAKHIEGRAEADESIVTLVVSLLPDDLGFPVLNDFGKGIIFNPHPSRIRLPEDSAKTPGIRPDGSGLYSTLFALKRGRTRRPSGLRFMRFRPQEVPFDSTVKLDRLLEFFKLAYPAMINLTVTNDQFENIIRVRVTLEGSDKPQIPLAALSDGTLKWMAFITGVFTNQSILAIEEPENFVHPFAQREAVRLTRDRLPEDSFLIMSSHSETILNAAEPKELIVVSLKRGRTVADRVRDPDHLKALINKSGFGLGFYYLSGALADA